MVSAVFGSYAGKCEAEVWLEGRKLKINQPIDAVRVGISMVPEDRKRQGIVPLMGVGYNITMSVLSRYTRFGLIDVESELAAIQIEIQRMKIKTAHPLLPIASLSGGNQQKAVVGKMLMPNPKVLILDEPTRGIDVGAKYEIYKLVFELAKQGVAVLMVSSELPEVLGISDRVLVMGEGQLRGDFVNQNLTQEQVMAAAIGKADAVAA
jgi:D-xylose transport system ATP-binding protein